MQKNRLEKLPQLRTIARHYSEGKYVDYPSDIVMKAVNDHDFAYDSISIPIRVPFSQILAANFEAFNYLYEHNTEEVRKAFLSSPNDFFKNKNIKLGAEFDEKSANIVTSILEPEIYPYLKSENGHEQLMKSRHNDSENSWFKRHKERYPKWFMSGMGIFSLQNVPFSLKEELLKKYGFPSDFKFILYYLSSFWEE